MDARQMFEDMCHEVLTKADIKAICKSRGFSAQEASSRAHFGNFFLLPLGLESVLASLSTDEIVMLHLLKYKNEAVDTAFFWRLYGDKEAEKRWFRTYTERYKDVFSKVKSSFVRKGLLLIAEYKDSWNSKSKMERWRFRFPREFEKFLPSPFRSTVAFEGPGEVKTDVLRNKIMEVVQNKGSKSSDKHSLHIFRNELRLGEKEFQVRYLYEWQGDSWKKFLRAKKNNEGVSPVEAIYYAFSQLKANEGVLPADLTPILKLFCPQSQLPHPDKICHLGWEWGCLARGKVNQKTYYRLPAPEENPGPEIYLIIKGDGSLAVDLHKIPYEKLELLSRISAMNILGSKLIASPNLIKIGRAYESIHQHPLFLWLKKSSPAFRKAIGTVEKRRLKQVIHENLLLARVKDLSLKVKMEKHFSDSGKLVSLSKEFIAFPRDLLLDIEKLVKKSGHVVKRKTSSKNQ